MIGIKWRRSAAFLAACGAALGIFALLSRLDNKYTMSGALTQDGAILPDRDILESNGLIWLADGWELYPDVLLEPGSGRSGWRIYVGQVQTWAAFHDDASPYGQASYRLVLEGPEELPLCLNVNVPTGRPEEIRGIRTCRQNRGFWREEFFRHEDPRGREYFWLTGEFVNWEPDAEDTDEWALAHKYVSVVPIQTDMTDYRLLEKLRGRFGE